MTEDNEIIDNVQHLFSCWWWAAEQSVPLVMLPVFLHSFQDIAYLFYTRMDGD